MPADAETQLEPQPEIHPIELECFLLDTLEQATSAWTQQLFETSQYDASDSEHLDRLGSLGLHLVDTYLALGQPMDALETAKKFLVAKIPGSDSDPNILPIPPALIQYADTAYFNITTDALKQRDIHTARWAQVSICEPDMLKAALEATLHHFDSQKTLSDTDADLLTKIQQFHAGTQYSPRRNGSIYPYPLKSVYWQPVSDIDVNIYSSSEFPVIQSWIASAYTPEIQIEQAIGVVRWLAKSTNLEFENPDEAIDLLDQHIGQHGKLFSFAIRTLAHTDNRHDVIHVLRYFLSLSTRELELLSRTTADFSLLPEHNHFTREHATTNRNAFFADIVRHSNADRTKLLAESAQILQPHEFQNWLPHIIQTHWINGPITETPQSVFALCRHTFQPLPQEESDRFDVGTQLAWYLDMACTASPEDLLLVDRRKSARASTDPLEQLRRIRLNNWSAVVSAIHRLPTSRQGEAQRILYSMNESFQSMITPRFDWKPETVLQHLQTISELHPDYVIRYLMDRKK